MQFAVTALAVWIAVSLPASLLMGWALRRRCAVDGLEPALVRASDYGQPVAVDSRPVSPAPSRALR